MTQAASQQPCQGLLVVNLQNAFSPPQSVTEQIVNRLKNYRIVIATRFINEEYNQFEKKLNYTRCQFGQEESDFAVPLSPTHVLDLFGYGLRKKHIEYLKTLPVPCWDICGCDTEAGVLATCYNLWNNRVPFHVLKECCHSSGGEECQQAAFRIMKRSFGE